MLIFIFCFFYFIKVYSANLDIWLTSRTIFEWLPSGVVIVLQQVRGVYLDRYKFDGAWDYVQVSLEFLVAFMMVWHLIQEVVELCARGVSSYVRSFWNMVLRIILWSSWIFLFFSSFFPTEEAPSGTWSSVSYYVITITYYLPCHELPLYAGQYHTIVSRTMCAPSGTSCYTL
jgi:hypothetical protein